jgi:hypothetical protein
MPNAFIQRRKTLIITMIKSNVHQITAKITTQLNHQNQQACLREEKKSTLTAKESTRPKSGKASTATKKRKKKRCCAR